MGFVSDLQPLLQRGFGEEESRKVAELIIKTLKNAENKAVLEEVRSAVKELTDAFPLYED